LILQTFVSKKHASLISLLTRNCRVHCITCTENTTDAIYSLWVAIFGLPHAHMYSQSMCCPTKRNLNREHIHVSVTDNCPTWVRGSGWTNAPFRKISISAQSGRFALILWRRVKGLPFVFSRSDCHLTI